MLAHDAHGREEDPALVLIHGWPLDRSIWSEVAPTIAAAGLHVLVPDLPGFGGSGSLDEGRWTVEGFAEEIADFLDERTSGRVAVAGHSFGGYVALALAEHEPARLAALGLVSSRTLADSEATKAGRRATIEKVRASGTATLLPDLAAKLLAPDAAADLRSRAEAVIARARPEAVIAGLTAMAARPDRTGILGSFPRSLLILHGAADQLIPVAEAAHPASPAGRMDRVLLERVGHLPMWEDPPRTVDAIVTWARAAHGVRAPARKGSGAVGRAYSPRKN